MSDTPRTDALPSSPFLKRGYEEHGDSWGWGDLKRATDLCRELERELNKLKNAGKPALLLPIKGEGSGKNTGS